MIRSPLVINKPNGPAAANSTAMIVRLCYSTLLFLALPIILGRQLWRSRQDAGHRQRWSERLGFVAPLDRTNGRIIHFHLVSVGETLAALPLLNLWLKQHPTDQVHVTCMTLTGSREIQKRLGDQVSHSYLPYDLPMAMSTFYRRIPAAVTVIMETELWPNLLYQAKRHQVKTLVMNARLSERSFNRYGRWPVATQHLLAPVNLICCQNQATLDRFAALGARSNQLQLTGNLKFDMDIADDLLERGNTLRIELGEKRPIWIAGSTHDGEDDILLQAHASICHRHPDALLILVPRHPERFDQVAKLISQHNLSFERRSNHDVSGQQLHTANVLLGDTMGELMVLYRAADIAFVGGSLVERGGHNPLEPVALTRPVVSGRHVFNFTEVYQMLDEQQAVRWANDAPALATAVTTLLTDAAQANDMTLAASQVLSRHQGAKEKTQAAITSLLDE
ncbi:lipid IV(A) 3-deoxy-D-manno-octulosonic acid transferase [Neiella marina]|uniref:3-deoxy-D-manno-octulosonic acid transferase n=1 Tax=Neiella holothuriorum TaxID=2870530 RepID=A0ABS7EEF0_9GAMM|nr:lipid IV(A) 3-deoxy-D-manno-octulosonic acid transferase [Neiella holothuriorum]MBW8190693.1 lipid IV(A) 3-deoxy-D-manno-octulosonic acid transferase [Neiella holothuriorum]